MHSLQPKHLMWRRTWRRSSWLRFSQCEMKVTHAGRLKHFEELAATFTASPLDGICPPIVRAALQSSRLRIFLASSCYSVFAQCPEHWDPSLHNYKLLWCKHLTILSTEGSGCRFSTLTTAGMTSSICGCTKVAAFPYQDIACLWSHMIRRTKPAITFKPQSETMFNSHTLLCKKKVNLSEICNTDFASCTGDCLHWSQISYADI